MPTPMPLQVGHNVCSQLQRSTDDVHGALEEVGVETHEAMILLPLQELR